MTYTPEALRKTADLYEVENIDAVAAMLRAGADAMERENQARNQALEEASELVLTKPMRFAGMHEDNVRAAMAEAIRALKGDTINGEKLTEDDLQFFLDQDNQGEPQ
jgi:glutamine synthetase